MIVAPDQHVNVSGETFDFTLSTAMRVRDLLAGASGIVKATQPSSALAELIATARAAVGDVVDALEGAAAVDAERKRSQANAAKAFAGKEVR